MPVLFELKRRFFKEQIPLYTSVVKTDRWIALEEEWNYLQEVGLKAFTIFSEYAETHFKESYYYTMVSSLHSAGESIKHFQAELPNKDIWITKEFLNAFYIVAKDLFAGKCFEQSYSLFYTLSWLLPTSFDVWLGLGLSSQQLGRYEEAIMAFIEAEKIESQSLFPQLYLAESFFALKEWTQAKIHSSQGLLLATKDQYHVIAVLNTINIASSAYDKGAAA